MAISGNTVVVGTFIIANAAYVFDASTGNLVSTLADPVPGINDFGASVAVRGNTVVVGAYAADTGAADSGAACIFDAPSGGLLASLADPVPVASDQFGSSVSISGTIVAVGTPLWDGTSMNRGDVYLFDANGTSTTLDADGNGTADALSDGILTLRYLDEH